MHEIQDVFTGQKIAPKQYDAETLNLNCQALSLPQTRKNVLMAEKNRIVRKCKGKGHDAYIRELERTYARLVEER